MKDFTYLLVATELLIGNHKTVGEVPRFALGMTEFFYTTLAAILCLNGAEHRCLQTGFLEAAVSAAAEAW
ncbi:MAG: hypothetical protein DME42_04840 [Verrucomicrobia bacterium]|nr:MAG: hypothetical protein DME42_04840 [Verrucomicrobiota bacterium]